MSEISSGLVAVAWIAPTSYEWPAHFISTSEIRNGEPLVRLSDAEAIIAQKDAEILEQCRINGMGAEREAALMAKVEKQSAALKLAREALADVMEWCICQDSNFYKPCEEALATIDAIGEVK